MKSFKAIITLAALSIAVPAWAQTTGEVVRDILFSEAEKRIIGEHFGVKVQDIAEDHSRPEWAVKTDQDDDRNSNDKDDDQDRDDDEPKAKKDKGSKGKGKKDKADKGKGKGKSKGLPPGLAKRDSLPPGLQKQLDKNGRLPKGLAKRDLPADLSAKLPARDQSQEVTVVEDDVVLVDKATGVILDVIKDVVSGKVDGAGSTDGNLANPGPQSPNEDGAVTKILKGIFGSN
ncbi:MAG: hypothetical protein OQK24_04860 [Magnetovibrio sp.]|nr:hypothetical protein [Magnetovibrio sp.]